MIPTTNLLPAILIAAPHHSGKSVLAYLLSQHLRDAHVPHILLRAAPDGEGDWFYESADEVRLRQRQKGAYTPELVETLLAAIQRRNLPMLADIGGRPRGSQFQLLDACTHVIHLYRGGGGPPAVGPMAGSTQPDPHRRAALAVAAA